jgi:hypothetical protein
VEPTLPGEGVLNITDIRTTFIDIRLKVHKVKDNIISRTLGDNGDN